MSNPITPAHPFVRPGQVRPDWAAVDACMECGEPEHAHTASSYMAEASAADAELDEQLAIFRREEAAGEISPADAAHERVRAMEAHLATIRALRVKHFGGI